MIANKGSLGGPDVESVQCTVKNPGIWFADVRAAVPERELDNHETPSADMETEICACVSRLAATLKPEYAEALHAIEVTGTPVKTYAEQKGLSSSNAAVRVFRAREVLKKRVIESCGACAEHGCLNCTCKRA